MNNKQEIWKDILGFEGLYKVSNFGTVKSVCRRSSNGRNLIKEKFLKLRLHPDGYMHIFLHHPLKPSKSFWIHVLVAKYFISNPNNYKRVKHKDGNILNNTIHNLVWCNQSDKINNYLKFKSQKENPPQLRETEIILPIKHYDGYFISNFGNIFHFNKKLCSVQGLKGYFKVRIKDKLHLVHRLVALAFIPNINNLPQVNHKNGHKWDNHVDNLEWSTFKQNMEHASKMGLMKTKLTKDEVLAIRKEHSEQIHTYTEIKNRYNICDSTLYSIISRKTWKHI